MTRWIGLLAWGILVINPYMHAQNVRPLNISKLHLLRGDTRVVDYEKMIDSKNIDIEPQTTQMVDLKNSTLAAQRWNPLGSGLDNAVWAVASLGSDVYAGGSFTNCISRWDGVAWQSMGSGISGRNGCVYSIVTDSPSVFVGGTFNNAGGLPANAIARWDTGAWHTLGFGLYQDGYAALPSVEAMVMFEGYLYVGGYFCRADSLIPASNIARWKDGQWEAVGDGFNSDVCALAVMNGHLYAAGYFDSSGTTRLPHIAMWNGTSWQAVGSGMDYDVYALAAQDTILYAGGIFSTAGGVSAKSVAQWDGTKWDSLGSGIGIGTTSVGMVNTLAISESELIAGGFFTRAGTYTVNNIAKWTGKVWGPLGSGVNNMIFTSYASGENVYLGGAFTTAGGQAALRIVRYWNVPSTDISFLAGWNLASVPRIQANYNADVVFAGKFGSIFLYNSILKRYEAALTTAIGLGYWVYYTSATAITIIGPEPGPITVDCQQGWNLIGSQTVTLPLSSITLTNGAIIFGSAFRYNATSHKYEGTIEINSGEGVWLYVTKACTITLPE